ncbi:MAG: DUF4190 domain-containing protein [Lachnospiraceae bacterium]|nr:DUF4190 domain-containing protein [Lachnospiraceae bacterium]
MDYQPQNPQGGPNGYPPYPPYGAPMQPYLGKPKGDSMATASMILGIITLASMLVLQFTIPFLLGGVGIVLAILSRGSAKRLAGKAKAGLICCIVGLSLDIMLCVSAICLVFALPNLSPEFQKEVNKACEEQYGVSYDEMMEEFYEMFGVE